MITIVKIGRSWNVLVNGVLVEGGFFYRESAAQCARNIAIEMNCGAAGK